MLSFILGAGPSDATVYASKSRAESRCACACASYRAAPAEKRRTTAGSTIGGRREKSFREEGGMRRARQRMKRRVPALPRHAFRLRERSDDVLLPVADRNWDWRKLAAGQHGRLAVP